MRLDSVDVYHMAHPLLEPWTTAYGSDAAIHGVLVRFQSGDAIGWSEANPLRLPTYSPEYAAGVFHVISDIMAPLLIDTLLDSPDQIMRRLSEFKGNNFAKGALEMAWWQLHSASEGRPLYDLLGGSRKPVEVGQAIGISDSLDDTHRRVALALELGYQRIKLKIRPERDMDVLRSLRVSFPDASFQIDCNCAYTLRDMQMFRDLDKLNLTMIEQPLGYGDLVDHATLQQSIDTPICLDESCTSAATAEKAIELGSCRIINIKPARVGGLSNAVAILELCRDAGIGAWIGSMLETSIGAAANLALATLDGVSYPSDIFPSDRFFASEITREPLKLSGPGQMLPLAGASSSYMPLEEELERRTIRHIRLSADGATVMSDLRHMS